MNRLIAMVIFAFVKKLFSSITILISLSLIGIIVMQISWLKNLIALREDQVKQSIDNVYQSLSNEFGLLRDQYINEASDDYSSLFSQRSFFDSYKTITIGSKLTSDEIEKRIQQAFDKAQLKNMKFEYAFISGQMMGGNITIERQSPNFYQVSGDSLKNYTPPVSFIRSQSGSASENIAKDEVLFLTV